MQKITGRLYFIGIAIFVSGGFLAFQPLPANSMIIIGILLMAVGGAFNGTASALDLLNQISHQEES